MSIELSNHNNVLYPSGEALTDKEGNPLFYLF